MKRLILIALTMTTGCTGIGVVATSDPDAQLRQADRLMSEGRDALAEALIGQAMHTFRERGDQRGMADSHHAYGNLYKNVTYHGKWAAYFEKHGTYDPSYDRSLEHFTTAMTLYEDIGDPMGSIACLMGIGNVHAINGDDGLACTFYRKALAQYREEKAAGRIAREPIIKDRRYANAGELIEAFINFGCDDASE